MKLFARIADGAVAELLRTEADISRLFHPALVWVEVTGQTVAVGFRQQADGFAPPIEPAAVDPAAAPVSAIDELRAQIAALAAKLAALG